MTETLKPCRDEYDWVPACVAYTIEGYPIAVTGTEKLFVKRPLPERGDWKDKDDG